MTLIGAVSIASYVVTTTGSILWNVTRCSAIQNALIDEESALRSLAASRSEANLQDYEEACRHTRALINRLPLDYRILGPERYARTFDLISAYNNHSALRDSAVEEMDTGEAFHSDVYRDYTILSYLQTDASALTQITLNEGIRSFARFLPELVRLLLISSLFAILVFVFILLFDRLFTRSIVVPVQKMAAAVRTFESGDFSGEDIEVKNRDELGELTQAINRMKKATDRNITTMKENQRLAENLHKEEIRRVETEKRLETMRLSLLQSQINPHFLFNTLNVISGMATLEDAGQTERMIRALSNIFRYNLRTGSHMVALDAELSVVRDYLYLQQMRFGSRLAFDIRVEDGLNPSLIMVPPFILQPLVENAVLHGVLKKEEGGRVEISVAPGSDGAAALVQVHDDGVGIGPEKLSAIRSGIENRADPDEAHIGIQNVADRLRDAFPGSGEPGGRLTIESSPGGGTDIILMIPKMEGSGKENV